MPTKKEAPMPEQPSEEEVAREVSEDKRLNRLGIDPKADPVEVYEQVEKILKEIARAKRERGG
jgi:hypothetical protein